jgi:hypothetical protein
MSTAALQSTAIVSAAMLNSGQTPAIQIYNDPPSAGSPRKQLVFKQHQQHQQQQRQHDFGHQSKLHKSRSALRDLSNMAANSNNATATLSTKLTPMLGKLDLIQPVSL